jgi:hypothetical protein
MMKSKSIYTLAGALFVASVLLAGCAKEKGGTEPAARSAITIEASIGTPTKVIYNGDAASFAAGDQVSLYAWMGSATEIPAKKIVDGVVNTFNGTAWIPASQMLWSPVKENHYFLGVYPVKSITNFTADAYTLGADLMIATELDGIPFQENAEPVALTFTHAMARLDVNLKFRNQWAEIPTVTSVATTAKNGYTVNYLTKAITATGNAAQVAVSPLETAVSGHDRSYSGLQVPQEGVTKLTIVIDSQSFIFIAAEPIALESGKITTLNLFVGKDKIELGSATVAPWVEKDPIAGGEALIPITGISFKEGTAAAVEIGETFQLTPVFAPQGATDVNCTWKSLDTSIATVDEKGLVTAIARGEAVIECTCSGLTAQFTLTVKGLAPVYTAPTAKLGLVYNNTNLALLNAGSVTSEGPVMQYSLNQTSWSSTIPTGKNAGNYDVYWRLQAGGNYEGVASTKIVATIAKKAPSFSLSSSNVSFSDTDNVDATKTVTITYDGDGALSVSSNNTAKVTATLANKTITLTRKSVDGGSVTITVSAAAGTNYSAPANKQITVSLTSADPGTYLQNAVAGDKVGSNGKVYKPSATMPAGVTVVGCVVRPGVVFKATDEPGHLTDSQLYNYNVSAGKFHYHSMNDLWDRYWEIYSVYLYNQILLDKNNTGQSQATATAALNQVNSYLQAAGCDPIDVNRYYGTSNGWFYWPSILSYQTDPTWWHDNKGYTISARPAFTYDTK